MRERSAGRSLVLRSVGRAMVDLLLPQGCPACGTPVQSPAGFCLPCWQALPVIAGPVCDRCGLPFPGEAIPVDLGVGSASTPPALLCPACIARPPAFAAARAALLYDDVSRPHILALKHGDRLDFAPVFAALLHQAARPLLSGATVIAPVPLHWRRLLGRRYNQAAELAKHLSRRSGVPCCPDLLVRHRATPVLGELGAVQRRQAMAGAIAVPARRRGRVTGARVLLVDDVLTSGATADACAAALMRAGAAWVGVATLARVLRAT